MLSDKKIDISIVVPIYKNSPFIEQLYSRLKNEIEKFTHNFEIIFVNDSSPDDSWVKIKHLVDSDNRVIGLDLSRNFGQHYAITAGLDKSLGEWIVVMDGDLQDKPEEIKKMLLKAQEGYDIVQGRRYNRQDKFIKKMSSKLFYKLFGYLTDTPQDESIANFGVYSRRAINVVNSMRENLRFFPTMIRWIGFKSTTVDIEHGEREIGNSGYSFKKLLKLSLNTMISFSDKPLRLTVKIGFLISFISFIYAVYIIYQALFGKTSIQGWASLIVSIWFIGGIIIFIIGVTGLYISRIFDETKRRPIYIVREIYEK
ncbi:glycosyltransferase family 2 protein [Paenibacillus macerans]|uniref:glycosyltransferase family 2 protein n=1 Tax=Paenibacillus macerans TaxID=44252 RepID=UPI002DB63644|nr:glycosyltransferase family 2 protein [Paenibacillus macerans]MEC0140612.1 glycosyltransferase family 2 protein [Paenibacillus macerans]